MAKMNVRYWVNLFEAHVEEYVYRGAETPERAEQIEVEFAEFKEKFINRLSQLNKRGNENE